MFLLFRRVTLGLNIMAKEYQIYVEKEGKALCEQQPPPKLVEHLMTFFRTTNHHITALFGKDFEMQKARNKGFRNFIQQVNNCA